MPSTVGQLLEAAGFERAAVVRWGVAPPLDEPGVYVVARTDALDVLVPWSLPDISADAVAVLLGTCLELTVDGCRPSTSELVDRLECFWLPHEPVVYVGLASTSVRARVNAYYRTRLVARKPHAGGWFLKTLTALDGMWVHVAASNDPVVAEDAMLRAFCFGVSDQARAALLDPEHPFPFGNLEWPPGTRKCHGIVGAKERRTG